jgi:hypothetical protein
VNDELVRKQSCGIIEVLSQYVPGGAEENHENLSD